MNSKKILRRINWFAKGKINWISHILRKGCIQNIWNDYREDEKGRSADRLDD